MRVSMTWRVAALAVVGVAGVATAVSAAPGDPAAPGAPAAAGPMAMTSGFYSNPALNAKVWVQANAADPRAAQIGPAIADVPQGIWFGDTPSTEIRSAVDTVVTAADQADKLPTLVAYNMTGRDCGDHSRGGAASGAEYQAWISEFAAGIGDRPAVVILEPDALAQRVTCVPEANRAERLQLLQHAAAALGALPNTWTYLDSGNPGWPSAETAAAELAAAGVHQIRGFALNTSNYASTGQATAHANDIAGRLNAAGAQVHAVVDTSRNGNGPAAGNEWCNPAGRKVGAQPQAVAGPTVELLLWVKNPGDSDGDCGIGPGTKAGQFTPELAMALIGDGQLPTPAPIGQPAPAQPVPSQPAQPAAPQPALGA